MKLKEIIIKRINYIDLDILSDTIDEFSKYNIKFYNSNGEFNFNEFRKECHKTTKLLLENDEPINGIRYQLCDCLSAIQVIVGKRNFIEFMSE